MKIAWSSSSHMNLALSIILCSGCQGTGEFQLPRATNLPSQSAKPSEAVRPSVISQPSVKPSIPPSIFMDASSSSSPSAQPNLIGSTSPSPSNLPIPILSPHVAMPLPLNSPALSPLSECCNDFRSIVPVYGYVFNDQNKSLDNVKMTILSQDSRTPFKAETYTINGKYNFEGIPNNLSCTISASKVGFTNRTHYVLLNNYTQGNPNSNRYDFGFDGSTSKINNRYSALSDLPEIVKTTPTRNSSGVVPNAKIVLTFSEPMDKQSVEDGFSVRAFNARKLTVDDKVTNMTTNTSCLANNSFYTFCGDSQITTLTNQLIWDKDAFHITWNSDDSEVTLAPKNEMALPSDKDSDKVIDYQVAFSAPFKDKAGNAKTTDQFRLNDSACCGMNPADTTLKFAIRWDETAPSVMTLSGSASLALTFSKPMLIRTKTLDVAGGMPERFGALGVETAAPAGYPANKGNASERNVAKNYTVSVFAPGSSTPTRTGTWFQWGGSASYSPNDLRFRDIWLKPPQNTASTIENLVLNHQAGSTTPSTQTISSDAQDNSIWNFGWQLVRSDGTLSPLFTSGDLENAQAIDGSALATMLQTQLNKPENTTSLNPPMSTNPWQVSLGADQKSLQITLKDTSGHYVGWQSVGGTYQMGGNDNLPTGQINNTARWEAGQSLKWFSSGQRVEVTVAATVTDPAGNGINTNQRIVSTTVP